ncbi:CPBP family intramembrane metalloprotease [Paucibacter sp. B2R-40]|uniref:CPBP family intramembrane glutamic endopeptidase n=1 Tax=Paucibacter sp. B2R-40 TaxID=2893554 RepID=UPI0021E40182|nr:CPBP family intramembrane glutamic endopeptidase [Paucibacter sp. B2R-40]MCV2356527.1 CPBP family intramembrane metalloprotease [Paucibacter sp. B2R-40]
MNQRLAVSLATLLGWLLITLLGEQFGAGAHQALSETVSHGPGWPFVAAAAFVLAVVAWQRWRDIGLRDLPSARSLRLAWLPMVYIVGGFALSASLGLAPATVVLWVLVNTFLVGLSEELMFRGVLLQALRHTVSIWPAVALTTLAFGAVHSLNVFITGDLRGALIQSTAAALSGLFFIALRLRTGSLWPSIVIHGLWDCAAFLVVMSSSKDLAANAAPADAMSLAPILLVLPNALYGLWLMRHVSKLITTTENS